MRAPRGRIMETPQNSPWLRTILRSFPMALTLSPSSSTRMSSASSRRLRCTARTRSASVVTARSSTAGATTMSEFSTSTSIPGDWSRAMRTEWKLPHEAKRAFLAKVTCKPSAWFER
jgi:hypothetical protein